MSVLRRCASPDGATLSARPALAASLVATFVVLLATLTGAGGGPVLLTAATVGVLTVVLATTAAGTVRPVPLRVHSSGVAGAVPASTAYWCALDAPRCPQRPRAPDRH
jgi:hypothetical protein